MKREIRQKIKVLNKQRDSSNGGQSPYWDDFYAKRGESGDDRPKEHPLANPDSLPATENANPSTPQMLMGEAVEHLQGRQKEVYILTMREGKSLAEAAEILNMKKGTAQTYRERAIKFISAYCRQAIRKGRV